MSSSQSKNLTAEELGEAAVLIREHLWLGPVPPPPPHPNQGKWTMGRDLSIYKRLVVSGRTAEQINLAIRHVRSVLRDHANVPLRLTIFYNGFEYATPLFEQALGIAYKAEESNHKQHKKLPPSIRSILREMAG